MRRCAIDWRDFGEDGLDLLEDGVDENAPLRADCGQHCRHAQSLRRRRETTDVVDQESPINGIHGQADPRLVIDEHHSRVFHGEFRLLFMTISSVSNWSTRCQLETCLAREALMKL